MKQTEKTMATSAAKAGMDEKTARKYLKSGKLPSELQIEHTWRTREDPFESVWEQVRRKLQVNPGLEAKTLFQDLQRRYPGRYSDGQLRTLQRRVKVWRATEGPAKEVFFAQKHEPGTLCQSDFTSMNKLGVTIQNIPFKHLLYHFVLVYSDWETGTICFSESFESLSYGFQNAVWELGGVPLAHQTDRLSTAVQKSTHPEEFTRRYQALLDHYGIQGRKTQPRSPHENGDVEQRHYRLKKAVEQSLMLRGSKDFQSREEYAQFLQTLFVQLNAGRGRRLQEELSVIKRLPSRRLDVYKSIEVKVSAGSTVRVNHNVYSVDSRLIGERVRIKLYPEHLEIWYAQRSLERLPRLRGEGKHRIAYRHIIDWLVRKPGAFENYRYRDDLFPTSRFRIAYDSLKSRHTIQKAGKDYLQILALAAKEGESLVDGILQGFIEEGTSISVDQVKDALSRQHQEGVSSRTEVTIQRVDLHSYDRLLEKKEAV